MNRLLDEDCVTALGASSWSPLAEHSEGTTMSDIRNSKKSEQSENLERPMFGQVNLEVAQRFWRGSETLVKALSDWNTEITHFVSQRINRSSEAVGRVTQCRSLP